MMIRIGKLSDFGLRWLEQIVYLLFWMVAFLSPIFISMMRNNESIHWNGVISNYRMLLPFFIIFLLHEIALTLMLNRKINRWIYALVVVICLIVVATPAPLHEPHRPPHKPMMEPPQHQMEFRDHGPVPPPALDRERRFFDSFRLEPPFGNLLLAIILMGANVLIKLQFRSVKKLHRLKELEKQHVETELAYLKSQINPHFFMNTLNNIHALIDVDSNKAKETVIELSKLMRYLLYESSQPTIPLSKEINFLAHFVELMKLRYTDEVEIVMELPEEVPTSIDVPPLLFLPFLENAFKHGVSYRRKSYIHFSLKVEGQNLVCVVKNSNNARTGDKLSGIGLENVRKRLQLLYEDRYSLNVSTTEEEFAVVLVCSYSQHSSKP